MQFLRSRRFLVGFGSLVLFTGLAGDAFRNAFSWYGYGVICLVVVATSVAILIVHRGDIRFARLPRSLLAFLGLALVSIAWSFYPGASALGVFAQVITTTVALATVLPLTRDELLRAFGHTLRIIIVLSLVFELFVAFVVRTPVFPVWVPEESRVNPPQLLYWSRNLLLEGDKIQGIVGSSTLLGMIALVALITFGVQSAQSWNATAANPPRVAPAGPVAPAASVAPAVPAAGRFGVPPRIRGLLWVGLAVLVLALTRSATVNVAAAGVAAVLAAILLVRATSTPSGRRLAFGAILVGIGTIVTVAYLLRGPILDALGKSDTLTGRQGIWDAVIGLAQQRPVFGWGWVSFWPPWVKPFNDLIERGGIIQLHAHEAWLDVWLQLGIVGLVIFGFLVLTTAVRAWLLAIDPVPMPAGRTGALSATIRGGRGRYSATTLFAPLLLTAMLVQSLAESRILIEGGWIMLVILAVSTKLATLGQVAPSVRGVSPSGSAGGSAVPAAGPLE